MSHIVKCVICGEQFNRDKIQAVKISARRYAHHACKPDGELVPLEEKDPDLVKLEEYIKALMQEDFIGPRVRKQIKDFQEQYSYSYSGMLKSLIYFYEVKGNSKANADKYGIGIIPYVYKDAYNYYYDLFLAKSRNDNKDITEVTSKVKEITIKLPVVKMPMKLFNLDEEEE